MFRYCILFHNWCRTSQEKTVKTRWLFTVLVLVAANALLSEKCNKHGYRSKCFLAWKYNTKRLLLILGVLYFEASNRLIMNQSWDEEHSIKIACATTTTSCFCSIKSPMTTRCLCISISFFDGLGWSTVATCGRHAGKFTKVAVCAWVDINGTYINIINIFI